MCMWKCTSWKDVINTELLNHPHAGNKIPLREFKDCITRDLQVIMSLWPTLHWAKQATS